MSLPIVHAPLAHNIITYLLRPENQKIGIMPSYDQNGANFQKLPLISSTNLLTFIFENR